MRKVLALIALLACRTAVDVVNADQVDDSEPIDALVTVKVTALGHTAAEGKVGTFQIDRDTDEGSLTVNLTVGGDAMLDHDYTVSTVESLHGTQTSVILRDGEASVRIIVEVVDDAHAEADESITLKLGLGKGYTVDVANSVAKVTILQNDFVVTNTFDHGEGSLRQAITNANNHPGLDTITFDSTAGPFATPQTIPLASELPELIDDVVIDGRIPNRLWQAVGVTVSGGNAHRVFSVSADVSVIISALTVADGRASDGAGVLNRGTLLIRDVTLVRNVATDTGGGLANSVGKVKIINSTFADNTAGSSGGGFANILGEATVTNCTFSGNVADTGGGLFNRGSLLLRNTILANSGRGKDCVNAAMLDRASTNNLIEMNDGCGRPMSTADPGLESLRAYNGPTHTFALRAGSAAINLGDNASAVDENGQPLRWDQRGNGDPRFVGGITDIGSFEHQAFPILTVDTVDDTELRGCTRIGRADCSLRGAINLANASVEPVTITFDPHLFAEQRAITLVRPLPEPRAYITIDGSGTGGVRVITNGQIMFEVLPNAEVTLREINRAFSIDP